MEEDAQNKQDSIDASSLISAMKEKVKEDKPEEIQSHLSYQDFKALKRSKYHEKQNLYDKSFVLLNKKTNSVVELRGVSSTHACKFIGWRPRHVQLLETRSHDKKD
jgi:predicted RND superfamily exporter protein